MAAVTDPPTIAKLKATWGVANSNLRAYLKDGPSLIVKSTDTGVTGVAASGNLSLRSFLGANKLSSISTSFTITGADGGVYLAPADSHLEWDGKNWVTIITPRNGATMGGMLCPVNSVPSNAIIDSWRVVGNYTTSCTSGVSYYWRHYFMWVNGTSWANPWTESTNYSNYAPIAGYDTGTITSIPATNAQFVAWLRGSSSPLIYHILDLTHYNTTTALSTGYRAYSITLYVTYHL